LYYAPGQFEGGFFAKEERSNQKRFVFSTTVELTSAAAVAIGVPNRALNMNVWKLWGYLRCQENNLEVHKLDSSAIKSARAEIFKGVSALFVPSTRDSESTEKFCQKLAKLFTKAGDELRLSSR